MKKLKKYIFKIYYFFIQRKEWNNGKTFYSIPYLNRNYGDVNDCLTYKQYECCLNDLIVNINNNYDNVFYNLSCIDALILVINDNKNYIVSVEKLNFIRNYIKTNVDLTDREFINNYGIILLKANGQ